MPTQRELRQQIHVANFALACACEELRRLQASPDEDDDGCTPPASLELPGLLRRTAQVRREDEAVGRRPGSHSRQYMLLHCGVHAGAFARLSGDFSELEWQPLFADTHDPARDAHGPLLVALPLGDLPPALLEWALGLWLTGYGAIHIDSKLPLDVLAAMLRERLIVETDAEPLAVLPFYDRRILLGLAHVLTPAQRAHFFAPIERWTVFDPFRKDFYTFITPRDAATDPACKVMPMTMAPAQLAALAQYDSEIVYAAIVGHWQRYCTAYVEGVEPQILREIAIAAVSRSAALGVTSRHGMRQFAHLMVTLSPSFDEHPAVRNYLTGDEAPGDLSRIAKSLPRDAWTELMDEDEVRFDALFQGAPAALASMRPPHAAPLSPPWPDDCPVHPDLPLPALGRASTRVPVPDSAQRQWQGRLPPELLALWQREGWSAYADGLFWIVDPDAWAGVKDMWLKDTAVAAMDRFHVIARSAFGHLYLWGERSGQSVTIRPYRNTVHALMRCAGREITNADFHIRAFFAGMSRQRCDIHDEHGMPMFERALAAHGPLRSNEVYGFEPALCVGGTRQVDALARLDGGVHLSILRQLGGASVRGAGSMLESIYDSDGEDEAFDDWHASLYAALDS